jgi:hypothetical protein
MEPVSAQLDFGVDRNSRYEMADRAVPGAASPIWAIGPCIMSESIRDASRGHWPNPRSYKTVDTTHVRVGFS